ncbi:MAG: transposase [Desulfatiglandaceae bacterium]
MLGRFQGKRDMAPLVQSTVPLFQEAVQLGPRQGLRVTSDSATRRWEKLIDGKLVVESTLCDLPPEDVIRRYKELQLIERGFRSMKSSLKLRPFYHWTKRRIRAHVFLCVMALQMERYMTARLQP